MPRQRITLVVGILAVAFSLLVLVLTIHRQMTAGGASSKSYFVHTRTVQGASGEITVMLTRDGRALSYLDGVFVGERESSGPND